MRLQFVDFSIAAPPGTISCSAISPSPQIRIGMSVFREWHLIGKIESHGFGKSCNTIKKWMLRNVPIIKCSVLFLKNVFQSTVTFSIDLCQNSFET